MSFAHTFRVATLLGLAAVAAAGAQETGHTCFSGLPRPACSAFVLFEASAERSSSTAHALSTTGVVTGTGTPITVTTRVVDLPDYVSAGLGYLRMTGATTAIGGVAEFRYSNFTPGFGNSSRVAAMARARRWYGNRVVDVGAGPLVGQVFVRSPDGRNCCTDRALAYGATGELAVTFRELAGVTGGLDVIHGAGRTSTGVHGGVRLGSYGAVGAAVVTAVLGGIGYWMLGHSD